jgi:hypothetical protein
VDSNQSSAAQRIIHPETRSGDPFHAAGAKLVLSILSSDECSECCCPIDPFSDGGLPLSGRRWICSDCASIS